MQQLNMMVENECLVVELYDAAGTLESRSWVPLERLRLQPSKVSLPESPSAIENLFNESLKTIDREFKRAEAAEKDRDQWKGRYDALFAEATTRKK